jgi:hypothetical protein
MKTSSLRSRRHRNPQRNTDVPAQSAEQAAPFFSNGHVQTKRETAFFQPKLTIGKADDPYEREADAVADKVVNKTTGQSSSSTNQDASTVQKQEISSIQRLATPDEDKMPATNDGRMAEDKRIQEKPIQRMENAEMKEDPSVQKAAMPKEEEKPAVQKMEASKEEDKPAVQKMEASKEEDKPAVQKMEASKEEDKPAVQKMEAPKEEEKPAVQKMEAPKEEEKPAVQKMEASKEEEEPVQAKAESGGGVASQAVTSKIDSTKGQGEQMPEKTKGKMESAFGRDFSDVHIHNDTASVDMNRELNAQAFTHGRDIYFNSGKFNPENTEGSRLLAHELTHVVQQKGDMIQKGSEEDDKEAAAVEAAKAKLKAVYGFVGIEGDKIWLSKELNLAFDALSKLDGADKQVLKGLKLLRTAHIDGADSRTAGLFSYNQSVNGTEVTNNVDITLGDIAFEGADPIQAQQTIIHEVGHAIASFQMRTATHDKHNAIKDSNEKVEISNSAGRLIGDASPAAIAADAKFKEYEAKFAEYKTLIAQYNAAKTAAEQKLIKPQLDQSKAESDVKWQEYQALNAEHDRLEKDYQAKEAQMNAAKSIVAKKEEIAKTTMISTTDLARIANGADTAHQNLDALPIPVGISPADKEQGAAYENAVSDVSADVKLFHDETKGQALNATEVDTGIQRVEKKVTERNKAKEILSHTNGKNALLTSLAAIEKAQDACFKMAKAHALAHKRKAIIQTFVEFVEDNNIPPTEKNMTKYAEDSWPHKPEEYYAEAFSFFVTGKLKAINPILDTWFAKGAYKPK